MNDFTRLTPEQGFRVHGWMRTLFDLSGTELMIFAIVYNYTKSGGEGVGGNRFFVEWTGASEDTVTRSLKNLEQAGLILANGAGRGKLKKYTISDKVSRIENYPQNADTLGTNYPQNADTLGTNYPQNAGSQESLPPAKCGYHPPQNAGTTTRKMRVHHPQNAGSNQTIKENESKLERKPVNTTPDINSTPREELPPIAQRAMRPPEAPAFHEVYSTMESLTFRPSGTELERCVRAFYDREERQGWKGNWKGKVQSYAASWLNNHPPTHYRQPQRQQARGCQPDDTPVDYGEIPW